MGNVGRGRTVDDEDSQPSDDMIITTPPPALSAFLPRCIAHWPDLEHYAESARIEPLQHGQGWCWGVTVTVFDKAEDAENLRLRSIEIEQDLL